MFSAWLSSTRKIILGVGSYAVAVVLRDVPAKYAISVNVTAGVVVFLVLVTDEYYTNVRPAKRIEELAPITLDGLAEPLLEQLEAGGIIARLNLMIPGRSWKWLGLLRYFKIRWSKGMRNQPDVNLSFRLRYGVTGACFRSGKPVYANPTEIRSSQYALPKSVRRHAPDLQAIFAYPVYEPPARGGTQSGKLLGVLNLDSATVGAYNTLMAANVRSQVDQAIERLADFAGRFYQ